MSRNLRGQTTAAVSENIVTGNSGLSPALLRMQWPVGLPSSSRANLQHACVGTVMGEPMGVRARTHTHTHQKPTPTIVGVGFCVG